MRILLTSLIIFSFAWLQPLLAQSETESVQKHRVSSGFQMPVVTAPVGETNSTNPNPEIAMISPDSFGVRYQKDSLVDKLLALHTEINCGIESAKGFRIQIYAGSSLESANDSKADYLQVFDDDEIPVYQMWNPPHFRVRVGNFLSRAEAMREIATIRQIFPDAFIVSDEVKLPKFKKKRSMHNGNDIKGN